MDCRRTSSRSSRQNTNSQISSPSVTIASIFRAASVKNSIANKADTTWSFIDRGIWTLIEANLGIVGSCLPTLRKPLTRTFPHIFGSNARSSDLEDERAPCKGTYPLSSLPRQESNSALWRGGGRGRPTDSISRPETIMERKSDERCTIDEIAGENDSRSELLSAHGVTNSVEIARTLYHIHTKENAHAKAATTDS